jgi:hypothetical protein
MKRWASFFNRAILLAVLTACSGGGGPMGGTGPVGGSLDAGGNYAAGPVSLPSPATLNKNLIVCENVAGPRVECRGSDGAAPAKAHIKLTVYSRFSANHKSLMDYLIPSAHALVGNTDFCEANAAGAFGATGDCSVVAAAGEKVGICVANSSNVCAGPELLITVPVEGATASGSSGTIKSMSVDQNGDIIVGKAPMAKPWWKSLSFSGLFFGTAQAELRSAPLLTPSAPVNAACSIGILQAPTAYQAPADSTVTIRKRNPDESFTDLFSLPGSQDDLGPIYAGPIGNPSFIAVALKNTLYIVSRESSQPVATRVFPAPIKQLGKVAAASALSVYLSVPKGAVGLYNVAPDTFDTQCVTSAEVYSFTNPDSFTEILGHYTPPGDGYRVPLPFRIHGGVGYVLNSEDYQVIFRQEAQGDIPAWDGTVHSQATMLKDLQFLYVSPTKVVAVVLDPEANRILLIARQIVSGETTVTPVSLAGYAETPVAMRLIERYFGTPRLLLLDSGERGARAVTVPVTGLDNGEVALHPIRSQSKSLGAIVANALEYGGDRSSDWVTYDLVSGDVTRFDPNTFAGAPAPEAPAPAAPPDEE